MPPRNNRLLIALLAALLLLAGCSIRLEEPGAADVERTPLEQVDATPRHSELSTVIERVLPSVVNVKVESISLSQTGPPIEGSGEGSGVVIDPKGIILTNYHVVAGAVEVRVVFTDDRDPLEGRVIGGDPDRDLAVIEVEADDLEAIEIGRSSSLKLGDGVVAIGFPLGLGGNGTSASPTVTAGILSGTERTIEAQGSFGIERLVGLLQTDAAINPGNSGGPLIDLEGRLIGINTAVAGSAENIGFAIAIDEALPIINEILTDPPDEQAWLGVQLGDITSGFAAEELGVPPDTRGAVIFGLIPGSPAEAEGLQEGDVIVELNGQAIESSDALIARLRRLDPGTRVELSVVSAVGNRIVEVELARRPLTFEAPGGEDE
ncbi:MAG: S1C family serine protease [Actinomycetota bacterium]